ncbi:MAG: hypothetical protein FWD11_10250 [Micrococcales bacterium]|nr:hypothetical protein [Micrococcales bacterium]
MSRKNLSYSTVSAEIRIALTGSDKARQRTFGLDSMRILCNLPDLESAAREQFDSDAVHAILEARDQHAEASPDQIEEWLERIEAGDLDPGNTGTEVFLLVMALAVWQAYLESDDPQALRRRGHLRRLPVAGRAVAAIELLAELRLDYADWFEPDDLVSSDEEMRRREYHRVLDELHEP